MFILVKDIFVLTVPLINLHSSLHFRSGELST